MIQTILVGVVKILPKSNRSNFNIKASVWLQCNYEKISMSATMSMTAMMSMTSVCRWRSDVGVNVENGDPMKNSAWQWAVHSVQAVDPDGKPVTRRESASTGSKTGASQNRSFRGENSWVLRWRVIENRSSDSCWKVCWIISRWNKNSVNRNIPAIIKPFWDFCYQRVAGWNLRDRIRVGWSDAPFWANDASALKPHSAAMLSLPRSTGERKISRTWKNC